VRWAKLDIRRGKIPSMDEVEEARTSVFFEKIRATLDEKKFKPHDRMIDRLLDQGYASTDICSALISMLQGATGTGPGGGAPAGPSKTAGAPSKPAFGGSGAPGAAVQPAMAASAPGPAAAEAPKPLKTVPAWAKPVAYVKPKPAMLPVAASAAKAKDVAAPAAQPVRAEAPAPRAAAPGEPEEQDDLAPRKSKYERPARTGREPGMKTIFLNVGRKQLVTPADIVGKIAGVTRLPANVVGALDIHQRHTLADVAEGEADFIVKKLAGIMLKGIALAPALAGPENEKPDA
jgi:ATP-dependent RNA helicase DeaD